MQNMIYGVMAAYNIKPLYFNKNETSENLTVVSWGLNIIRFLNLLKLHL